MNPVQAEYERGRREDERHEMDVRRGLAEPDTVCYYDDYYGEYYDYYGEWCEDYAGDFVNYSRQFHLQAKDLFCDPATDESCAEEGAEKMCVPAKEMPT